MSLSYHACLLTHYHLIISYPLQTAIHGSSFLVACKDAFFTIARNIRRVGAVAVVSGIGLLVGKLFVTITAAVTSYFWFDAYYRDKLYDFVAPTVLVMILAWFTATMVRELRINIRTLHAVNFSLVFFLNSPDLIYLVQLIYLYCLYLFSIAIFDGMLIVYSLLFIVYCMVRLKVVSKTFQ
jgi:hypothetical protein